MAIPRPLASVQIIDPDTGRLTTEGVKLFSTWHNFLVGTSRVIPCTATGTNAITLTPIEPAPGIEGYADHDVFVATAANTTTGVVTATVVPRTGALATLKVYKTDGAAQATTGDLVANSVYLFVYASHLDSAAGGFVRK